MASRQVPVLGEGARHSERPEQTIWEVFEDERPKLIPYRGRFDRFHVLPAAMSKTCLVRFDNNKHSVSASAVGRLVDIHAYADRIVIPPGREDRAEHRHSFGRGETIYAPWHYVPVLAREPSALRNDAPFKDWVLPTAMARIRRKLAGSNDGDRQMVKILAAVLTDGLAAVDAACLQALSEGVHSADFILNVPARQRDPGPLATILTPEALRLCHAPAADCARYDRLQERLTHGKSRNPRRDGRPQALRDKERQDETLATAIKRKHEPQRFVGDLLKAEISEKQARSIKHQLTIAKLPLARDVEDFAFKDTPINEALVRDLAGGGFVVQQRNVVLVGGTGTGKTHLGIAIARSCIRSGSRGRFFTTVDLVTRLEAEVRAGRQRRIASTSSSSTNSATCPFAQAGGSPSLPSGQPAL